MDSARLLVRNVTVAAEERESRGGCGQSTGGIFQQINQISIFDCENVNLHDICAELI